MAYSDEVLADNPMVYYRLEEASGASAVDSSANAYTGTLVSPTYGVAGAIEGEAGNAMTFAGGTTGYIKGPRLPLGDTATIEFWFKIDTDPTTLGSHTQVFCLGDDLALDFVRFEVLNSDGRLRMYGYTDAGTALLYSAGAMSPGQWHHVVGFYSSQTSTYWMQIDGGVLSSTKGWIGSIDFSDHLVYGAANYWSGAVQDSPPQPVSLDEIAIYGHDITQARAAAHWEARLGDGAGVAATMGAFPVSTTGVITGTASGTTGRRAAVEDPAVFSRLYAGVSTPDPFSNATTIGDSLLVGSGFTDSTVPSRTLWVTAQGDGTAQARYIQKDGTLVDLPDTPTALTNPFLPSHEDTLLTAGDDLVLYGPHDGIQPGDGQHMWYHDFKAGSEGFGTVTLDGSLWTTCAKNLDGAITHDGALVVHHMDFTWPYLIASTDRGRSFTSLASGGGSGAFENAYMQPIDDTVWVGHNSGTATKLVKVTLEGGVPTHRYIGDHNAVFGSANITAHGRPQIFSFYDAPGQPGILFDCAVDGIFYWEEGGGYAKYLLPDDGPQGVRYFTAHVTGDVNRRLHKLDVHGYVYRLDAVDPAAGTVTWTETGRIVWVDGSYTAGGRPVPAYGTESGHLFLVRSYRNAQDKYEIDVVFYEFGLRMADAQPSVVTTLPLDGSGPYGPGEQVTASAIVDPLGKAVSEVYVEINRGQGWERWLTLADPDANGVWTAARPLDSNEA